MEGQWGFGVDVHITAASNVACDTAREQLLSLQDQSRGCGSGENARFLLCLFVPSVLSCFPCPPHATCAVEGHCPWRSCTRALVLPGFRRGRSPRLENAVSPTSSFCLPVLLGGTSFSKGDMGPHWWHQDLPCVGMQVKAQPSSHIP